MCPSQPRKSKTLNPTDPSPSLPLPTTPPPPNTQLSHTATGSPFPLLRPAFLVSNGLLYLGFLLIVVLSASAAISPPQFVQALFYLLGLL